MTAATPNSALQHAATPWYRFPLVWMLIAVPGSSVIVGIGMLTLSIQSYDGLVVDDYYKRGLQINQRLTRDREAASLGMRASFAMTDGVVRLQLAADEAFAPPAGLVLKVSHATRQGLDRTLALRASGAGRYVGTGLELAPGRWYLELGTPLWRLTGTLLSPGEQTVLAPRG